MFCRPTLLDAVKYTLKFVIKWYLQSKAQTVSRRLVRKKEGTSIAGKYPTQSEAIHFQDFITSEKWTL